MMRFLLVTVSVFFSISLFAAGPFSGSVVHIDASDNLKTAIENLNQAGGGVLVLEPGTWQVSDGLIPISAPIRIVGTPTGSAETVLTDNGRPNEPLFDIQAPFSMEKVVFNNWSNPIVSAYAGTVDQIEIRSCRFSAVSHYVISTHWSETINGNLVQYRPAHIDRFVLEDSSFVDCLAAVKLRSAGRLQNVFVRNNLVDGVDVSGFLIGDNSPGSQPFQSHYVITGNTVKDLERKDDSDNEIYAIQVMGHHALIADNTINTVFNNKEGSESFGIYTKVTHSTIRNNVVLDVAGSGIHVKGRSTSNTNQGDNLGYSNVVVNNYVDGPSVSNGNRSYGIALSTSDNHVLGNTVSSVDNGIYLHYEGARNVIENNRVSSFRDAGVRVDQVYQLLKIKGNHIYDSHADDGKGIYVNATCPVGEECLLVDLIIEGNRIETMNNDTGIYFNSQIDMRGVLIKNNSIQDVFYGVSFFQAPGSRNHVVITGNTIKASFYPIRFWERLASYHIADNTVGVDQVQGAATFWDGAQPTLTVRVNHDLAVAPTLDQIKIELFSNQSDALTYDVQLVDDRNFDIVLDRLPAGGEKVVAMWQVLPPQSMILNPQP